MKSLSQTAPKTKKIQKRQRRKRNIENIKKENRIQGHLELKTPVRKSERNMDEQKTVKKVYPSLQLIDLTSSLDFYQSYNPYVLGQINSISFHNGRFYDLLKLKKDCFLGKKQVRCNCLKSKCQAKYCDCYSKGIGCSSLCGCIGCKNSIGMAKQQIELSQRYCKCSKSGCIKKYCQCFQRGDACSSKCKCCNCENIAGQSQPSC